MVTVREAVTKRDLVRFMDFPVQLYKNHPCYVPDMLDSQVEDMLRDKNPAFEFCEAKCFMAERDGKMVGRIAGIHNTRANKKFDRNYLNITQMDFIDDDEVVDALFDAVEAYGRSLGCVACHGPLGFSDMDREGLLVEGFDRRSLFYTYYNHPYYVTQLERRGYTKEVDWVEHLIVLPKEPIPRITRISDRVKERYHLRLEDLDHRTKPLSDIIRDVFDLYNETYRVLFGMVAMTEGQVKKYVGEFLPMVQGRTTSFVYNDKDELVAFGICCPSLEEAQQKCRGRMFPFGWARLLHALHSKNNRQLDALLIAVRPDLQGCGINAVLMDDMLKKAIDSGFTVAETGPQLELNTKVQAMWKFFDATRIKRRRCFVRSLTGEELSVPGAMTALSDLTDD